MTLILSCSSHSNAIQDNAENINANFKDENFSRYYYSLKFSEDYIPLDSSSKIISKTEFYRMILYNDFVPVKMDSKNAVYYQLVRANPTEIQRELLKALVNRINIHYQMEGKELPAFDLETLPVKSLHQKIPKGKF